MKNKRVIEFESGQYWIEGDFIRVRFIDKHKEAFTIDDANMHLKAYEQLASAIGNAPILIDVRDVNTIISLEVLRYISRRITYLNKTDQAKAYLINSLGVKLLVNFYIKVIRSETASKVFDDEQVALTWLAHHTENNGKSAK